MKFPLIVVAGLAVVGGLVWLLLTPGVSPDAAGTASPTERKPPGRVRIAERDPDAVPPVGLAAMDLDGLLALGLKPGAPPEMLNEIAGELGGRKKLREAVERLLPGEGTRLRGLTGNC